MAHVSAEQFEGCLLGQCLGDALGAPVEGFPGGECEDYVFRQLREWWHDADAESYYPFGQYTDDSQLARELLESLVEHNGFDAADYADRIRRMFEENLIVGRGIACEMAANRLIEGVSWDKAGCPPPTAGNGTAMRAAPVGLIFFDHPSEMITIARQQGWITHRDSRCDAGSIAIAGATGLALRGEVEPGAFCAQLADWMEEAHQDFATYIRELPMHLDQSPREVLSWAQRLGLEPDYKEAWPGISPFVIPSVIWSIYCFLLSPDDYLHSISQSIAVGGDVDTTAAMTGAISGAYNGVTALPNHLLDRLHDRGAWKRAELTDLCKRAHDLVTQQVT